ncbi:MAG: DUF6323 family protein [Lachnospiraceae bacterium]|nr:DUF6323 family protein [Lachnospiraceae bacterium]
MGKNWIELLNRQNQIQKILDTNVYSEKYGLVLTDQDAQVLATERHNSLKEQRRVEFGQGIMPKLIFAFCDSDYIDQSSYVNILTQLQDIFYLFKNEMMDEITDEELIHFMKEQFETICYGDLEYLSGTCLENFARAIRAGYEDYKDTDGYGAYRELDEVARWDCELYRQALKDLCWK